MDLENTPPLKTKVYYQNELEYQFLAERWGGEDNIEKYLSKDSYEKLIDGFDLESIRLVQRTIYRIKEILASKGQPLDLWTLEEFEQLYSWRHTFIKQIIKIDDHVYAHENHLLPINHFEKGIFVDEHGVNQLNRARFKHKAIIDVGAFIGDSACILSNKTRNKIYCFEVLKDNFELLLKTIKYNKLQNAIPVNLALGASDGQCETINLYQGIANGSCCKIKTAREQHDTNRIYNGPLANMTTLDNFVKKNNIKVGLIKVDIEGAEQQFMEGAKQTIIRQKPSLIMSIYHNPSDFFNIKNILHEWVPKYKFKLFKPTDGTAVIDTVLLCEI